MTELTNSEENYLKSIFVLQSEEDSKYLSTSEIANYLKMKSPSVSEMTKKLSKKNLLIYKRYKGVKLTEEGEICALKVLRRHRLWEVFLVEKLRFNWKEIHEIAEELEHIKSPKLFDHLDKYLDYPTVDPHGDPIPTNELKLTKEKRQLICECEERDHVVVIGVKDSSEEFLDYLETNNIKLNTKIFIKEIIPFDMSMKVQIDGSPNMLGTFACNNIFVKKIVS